MKMYFRSILHGYRSTCIISKFSFQEHVRFKYSPPHKKLQLSESTEFQLDLEQLEDLENEAQENLHSPTFRRNIIKEQRKFRNFIKRKMIERKEFKPPQEANLLLWDAKEQIRFLHAEDPTEWTPERISSSFPISANGVYKLLKSKFAPKTLEELKRHDLRVLERWERVLAKRADEKGFKNRSALSSPNSRYLNFKFPVGDWMRPGTNEAFPLPPTNQKLVEAKGPTKPPGKFETMVLNYMKLGSKTG